MSREESKGWGPENTAVLRDFRGARELAFRAMEKVARRTLDPYFGEGKRALEIGAGEGFLRELYPAKGDWIQMDAQPAFLEAGKGTSPEGDQFVAGSAYEIPLENESVDLVAGWASFDVFENLDAAIAEVKRVLKPGGAFVHFLDIGANNAAARALLAENEMPHRLSDGGHKQSSGLATRRTGEPAHEEVRKKFVFKNFGLSDTIDTDATFEKMLKASLEKNGFKVLRSGIEAGAHIGKRTEAQEAFPDANAFYHGLGTTSFRNAPVSGVVEDTQIWIIVAEKPA